MTAMQIFLGMVLAAALGYTVLGYPGKYGALTGRSRLFRTVGLCIFDLLLILLFLGAFVDFNEGVVERVAAIRRLLYLMSCVTLTLTLPLIAALDALESYSSVRRERREFLNKLVEEERERVMQKKQSKPAQANTGQSNTGQEAQTDAKERREGDS